MTVPPPANAYQAARQKQDEPSTTPSPPIQPVNDNRDVVGNHTEAYPSVVKDPFLAFIPQLIGWAGGIVCHEVGIAQKAVCGCPKWSTGFAKETYTYYRANPRTLYNEIISGFTVAIMQVPESIAFSFVAGVPPLSGLHATFWMATITGLVGGKPGMISGAAGALAVVVADLTSDDGALSYLQPPERLNVLYMTMFVCGATQILFAWLRLAKVVRLIPETGMIGFMNGLAIIIFMAQLPAFQKCDAAELFVDCSLDERQWMTFQNDTGPLCLSLVQVALCMFIMKFFPRIPKIGRIIPASLVGLLVGTLLEHTLFRMGFGISTRTVEETAQMSGTLPQFNWPTIPKDQTTIVTVVNYALILAAIGGVESVLTLQACHEITDTVPKMADSNQELFAQGLANLISGLFQAMGGDAMIGQSTINIMNGARHRVSSTMSGIFMLLFVIAFSAFIELLPVATLTGVLFMVVLSTFQWKTFEILRYGRLSDSLVILLVTLISVFYNLAVGIAAGIIFSALVHAWDSGTHVDADIIIKPMIVKRVGHVLESKSSRKAAKQAAAAEASAVANGDTDNKVVTTEDDSSEEEEIVDVKYVHVKGSIFFGSARHFIAMFSVTNDPSTVVIDFKDALIIDHSAVAAIGGITHRFAKVGKRVLLMNLPHKSHGRLHRTGDHEVLKKTIIQHTDELVHAEEGAAAGQAAAVEGQQGGEGAPEETQQSAGPQTLASGVHHMDGIEVHHHHMGDVGAIGELHMFQSPVNGVGHEIERLSEGQGEFDVSDLQTAEDKKDS